MILKLYFLLYKEEILIWLLELFVTSGGGNIPVPDVIKYAVFTTSTSASLAKIKLRLLVNDEIIEEQEYTSSNTGSDWKTFNNNIQVQYVSQNWKIRTIDSKDLQESGTSNVYEYGTVMKSWFYGNNVSYLFIELNT